MSTAVATKPSLTLKRRLNAPPARVYQAWTDPQKMMRWYAPAGAETLTAETDARVGGRFHVLMRTADGQEHDVSGVYREVVRDEKLVFTWQWRSKPEWESLVTITLKRDGDGTILTLTHEQLPDEAERDGHRNGWSGALDKLAQVVA
ncbi:MAG: SRPBCC domain-containing protein [Hyphomicrobiales bacterium]|nr:SRPBCC domain-containing protein [Hyphomicrobiales bacterium]